MTRRALTMFSIANDVAKYFVILPALFVAAYPGLDALNVVRLASPQSAILSAVIFNAIIIVAVDTSRAPRGALRAGNRGSTPAPQSAGLRARRLDRAVHRHQGRRSRDHRAWPGLSEGDASHTRGTAMMAKAQAGAAVDRDG